MPESLHLEFACTSAEKKRAQSLSLQRQVGDGSKVLTTVILLLLLVGMLLGFYIRVQREVYSGTQIFFMSVLPFLLVMMVFLILVFSVHAWWTHSRNAVPQELWLSPESIAFGDHDGSGTLPWSVYDCFKETRWSFILWKSRTPAWTMFPKWAFSSEEDMCRCRELLSRHLQQSRWFFG